LVDPRKTVNGRVPFLIITGALARQARHDKAGKREDDTAMATTANKENFTWDGFGQVRNRPRRTNARSAMSSRVSSRNVSGTLPSPRSGDAFASTLTPHLSFPFLPQVDELTRRNQDLVVSLDSKDRELAELSSLLETGGDRLAAGVRESKIVEMSKKNRALTLAVARERAEKARLVTELKAARAGKGGAIGGLHGAASNGNEQRSESQIEKACREVVAEAAAAAELALKEKAEWKDKARDASARAERDCGRYNTVRAENDRLKAIIKKEVGEGKVDFGKLDESLKQAGGWRGRAREIATLRHKVTALRARLEAYENGVVESASSVRFGEDGDFADDDSESRPGTAATDSTRATNRSNFAVTHETVRQATARRKQLEDATTKLHITTGQCEDFKAKAKAATVRKDALERDVRSFREKLDLLKRKSANDDRLIDALREETKKVRDAQREEKESGGLGMTGSMSITSTGTGNFTATAVPAAVYKTMQRAADAQDLKLREREQQVLQLRAKIASMENDAVSPRQSDAPGDRDTRAFASTTRDIAAAAADTPRNIQHASQQHQDDIAALIEHAESLERGKDKLMGKLAIAEKTEASLRAALGEAHHERHDLKQRLETGGSRGGGQQPGYGDIHGGEDVASLRARLASTEQELDRVRRSTKEQLDSMEKEVELYYEMTEELKREARRDM
jgi:hypothetical protein